MAKRLAFIVDMIDAPISDADTITARETPTGASIQINDDGEWSLDDAAARHLHEALGQIVARRRAVAG